MGGSGSDAPLGAPPLPDRARPAEAKPTSRGCSRSGSKTTRSSPLCQHPPLASRAPPGHIGPTVLLRCHGTLVVATSRRRPIARPASDAPVLRHLRPLHPRRARHAAAAAPPRARARAHRVTALLHAARRAADGQDHQRHVGRRSSRGQQWHALWVDLETARETPNVAEAMTAILKVFDDALAARHPQRPRPEPDERAAMLPTPKTATGSWLALGPGCPGAGGLLCTIQPAVRGAGLRHDVYSRTTWPIVTASASLPAGFESGVLWLFLGLWAVLCTRRESLGKNR